MDQEPKVPQGPKKLTPKVMEKYDQTRFKFEEELRKKGARAKYNEKGEGGLIITDEQMEEVKIDMELEKFIESGGYSDKEIEMLGFGLVEFNRHEVIVDYVPGNNRDEVDLKKLAITAFLKEIKIGYSKEELIEINKVVIDYVKTDSASVGIKYMNLRLNNDVRDQWSSVTIKKRK